MGGPINTRLIFDGSVDAASSSPSSGVGSPPQLLTLERLQVPSPPPPTPRLGAVFTII